MSKMEKTEITLSFRFGMAGISMVPVTYGIGALSRIPAMESYRGDILCAMFVPACAAFAFMYYSYRANPPPPANTPK